MAAESQPPLLEQAYQQGKRDGRLAMAKELRSSFESIRERLGTIVFAANEATRTSDRAGITRIMKTILTHAERIRGVLNQLRTKSG